MYKKNGLKKGIGLIEIMIAAAVMLIAWLAVFYAFSALTQFSDRNTSYLKAGMLLEEGSEALRAMRDQSWTTYVAGLSTGASYRFYYDQTNGLWTATTSNTYVDSKFDRAFTLSTVSRDSSFNVVSSGGTVDSGSLKATITVSWKQGTATTSQSLETYIFNAFNN